MKKSLSVSDGKSHRKEPNSNDLLNILNDDKEWLDSITAKEEEEANALDLDMSNDNDKNEYDSSCYAAREKLIKQQEEQEVKVNAEDQQEIMDERDNKLDCRIQDLIESKEQNTQSDSHKLECRLTQGEEINKQAQANALPSAAAAWNHTITKEEDIEACHSSKTSKTKVISKPSMNLSSIKTKLFKLNKTQNQMKRMLQREQYDKEQQRKYRQDYCYATCRRIISSESTDGAYYYLCGGVTIETPQSPQRKQGSAVLNHFVQVLGTEVFEERGIVEVKLQNVHKGLTEFSSLIEQFSDQYQDIHNYYKFVQNLHKKKLTCESVKGFSKFSEIVSSNSDDGFNSFFDMTINKLINAGQKIFSYRVYKFDLFAFEYKLKSHGYSEDFVKTLGYSSLNRFRDLVMHRGLPEIFTQLTRQRIAGAHMIQISQKSTVLSEIDCRLLALDGIEIDTQLHINLLPFYDSHTPTYNALFDCSAMLEISTYNITNETLREVINVRREINYDVNDALKQDIYYELQSQLFVDKFYACLPHKVKKQMSVSSSQLQQQSQKNIGINDEMESYACNTRNKNNHGQDNYQAEIIMHCEQAHSRKIPSPSSIQLQGCDMMTACQQVNDNDDSQLSLHHHHNLEKVLSSSQHSTHDIEIEPKKICGYRQL